MALHRWPGNIRELANLVERLTILGHDPVEEADVHQVLPLRREPVAAGAEPRNIPPLSEALDEYERRDRRFGG